MARRLPLEAIVSTVSHPIYAPGRQQYNRYQEVEIPILKISILPQKYVILEMGQ